MHRKDNRRPTKSNLMLRFLCAIRRSQPLMGRVRRGRIFVGFVVSHSLKPTKHRAFNHQNDGANVGNTALPTTVDNGFSSVCTLMLTVFNRSRLDTQAPEPASWAR